VATLVHRQGAPFPAIAGPAELRLEDGAILGVDRGWPPDLPTGYHEILPLDGSRPTRLIVAPARCHMPEGLLTWGWAVQLYALRSRESWGMGDLGDLGRLAEWSVGTLGAGAIVLNPLHAALPLVPQEPSPYFPRAAATGTRSIFAWRTCRAPTRPVFPWSGSRRRGAR
jgi:4-alpha-glucanotransferase